MSFQPQNYALDFIQGMQGVSSMLNSRRELDLAEKRYAEESTLRKSADVRATEEHAIKIQKEQLDLAESQTKSELTKRLREVTAKPVDLNVGDLPNDPASANLYGNAHARVADGVKFLGDAVAKSGNDIMLTAQDIAGLPKEMQGPFGSALESYNVLTDPKRVGKTFTEPDTGRSYTTRFVGGVMATKKGTVVPLFYATYDDNPEEGKYVPATINATNSTDDLLDERAIGAVVERSSRMAKLLPEAAAAGVKDEKGLQEFLTQKRNEEVLTIMRQLDPVGAEKHALDMERERLGIKKVKGDLTDTDANRKAVELVAQMPGKIGDAATTMDNIKAYIKDNPDSKWAKDAQDPTVMAAIRSHITGEAAKSFDQSIKERTVAAHELTAQSAMDKAHKEGTAGDKEWTLLNKKADALVRAGTYENRDKAISALLQPDKKGADSEIYKSTLTSLLSQNEKELDPKKKLTLEEMIEKSNIAAEGRPKGKPQTGASNGLTPSVRPPIESFDTSNGKPRFIRPLAAGILLP